MPFCAIHVLDSILLLLHEQQNKFIVSLPNFNLTSKTCLDIYLNSIAGAQNSSFKQVQDMEATMATFVSEMNDRLSMLEKRMDEFDPNSFVKNKHTHYPSPENAGI